MRAAIRQLTKLVVGMNASSTDFTDDAEELLADSPAFPICVNQRNLRTTGRIALRLGARSFVFGRKTPAWTQVGRKRFYFASKNKWIGWNDLTAGNNGFGRFGRKIPDMEREIRPIHNPQISQIAQMGRSWTRPHSQSAKSADHRPHYFAPSRLCARSGFLGPDP